jgi:hypothetical protein
VVLGDSFVRQPQDKVSEPLAELPNPELNPLLNPTLGRHLGRWAEVYFTSPPEKREEAVGELLRELKATPGSMQTAEAIAPKTSVQTEPIEPMESPLSERIWDCPDCGHRHANSQRFCGMCGAPLNASPSDGDHRAPGKIAQEYSPQHEYIFAQGPIFGVKPESTIALQPNANDDADISWLREKNLRGGDGSTLGRIPKLAPAALAMLAIGILIYAQSRPQAAPPRPATTTTQSSVPQSPSPTQAASDPAQAAPSPRAEAKAAPPSPRTDTPGSSTPSSSSQAESVAPKQSARSADLPAQAPPTVERTPATQLANTNSQPDTGANNATNGSQELALAEDYLNGRRGPRDSAEAAKFLWKAVGKENPSAILLLSDMYLVGDGVPKSCDQARLLLTAAVRKNVPQATQKLRNLLVSGCP